MLLIVAKMQLIVCDTEQKIEKLLEWGKEKFPNITTLVHMNNISESVKEKVKEQGWTAISFSEMEVSKCCIIYLTVNVLTSIFTTANAGFGEGGALLS